MKLKSLIIYIILLPLGAVLFAQTKPVKQDTVPVYEKIETYSERHRLTKTLYKLIFKSSRKKKARHNTPTEQPDYSVYQGKPIRRIIIETLDPFGYAVEDTTKRAKNRLGELGNKIHIKSNNIAIKNLLLFKKNTALDTLLLTESKRLMRSQKFIRSVQIEVSKPHTENDSVDVKVRVLDSWSLIPEGSISTSKLNFKLKERNFLGFGHQFNNQFIERFDDSKSAYSFEYIIPTIKKTYINTALAYEKSVEGYYKKSIRVERDFISPLTRWAGGIYLEERFRQDSLPNTALEFKEQNFKFNTQDIWIGHAFNIFKKYTSQSRTTNLITALRFANANYKEDPKIEYDPIDYFADEVFYMGRIGVASRQFVEDAYIFRDGIVEDVPIGFAYSITSGVQRKNSNNRLYFGGGISVAKYSKRGYFNARLEYGTFLNHRKAEQTAVSLELNYFTDLMSLGNNWKMRQFIKPQILLGFNRLNSIGDRLNLNEDVRALGYDRNEYRRNQGSGIPGFDAEIYGSQKMLLSLQTQFYSPWNILGFRLNPYINITSGLMGKTDNPVYNKKLYTSVGVGFIIRNDYLVFNSFQLSLSYYPTIPGQGHNLFKTNSFRTHDFGFQAIEIGKPSTVWHQ